MDYAFTHGDVVKFYVDPKYDTTIDDLLEWKPHVTFICAPTPMSEDGFVDASIVEDAVLKLNYRTIGSVNKIKITESESELTSHIEYYGW